MITRFCKTSISEQCNTFPMVKSLEHEEVIRIYELSKEEIKEIDKIENVKNFGPVSCMNCGFKGPFTRKLFRVEGLNDETHTLIEWHLKNNHDLEHCVFRVVGDRKFAEGAICPKCNSSCITYDLSKKLFREMMKDAEKYMVDDHPDDNLEQTL